MHGAPTLFAPPKQFPIRPKILGRMEVQFPPVLQPAKPNRMAAMAIVVFLILSLPLKNPGTESSKRFFVEQLYVTVQVMQIADEKISTFRILFLTLVSISRVTVFRQFIG